MPAGVHAETIRVATWAAPLSRAGPGMLLRDILAGDDPQILAIASVLAEMSPDVILLTDFDFDYEGRALSALAEAASAAGATGWTYQFALMPNSGMATGIDMDGNGRLGEARDAQGYGRFPGDGGMAILSRLPIDANGVRDLSAIIWSALDWASLPTTPEGGAYPSDEARHAQRLSTTGHWIVPIALPDGRIFDLLGFSATPPVFDGPEDMNGLRNRDELRLWSNVLTGDFGPVARNWIVIGNANLDPLDGAGYPAAMTEFLADPRLQDPRPASTGGVQAADPSHRGDPALDTADWPDDPPGNLRVSYVLPSAGWRVAGAGVFWPEPGDPNAAMLGPDGLAAGPHRLVWVDLSLPLGE